MKDAKPFHCRRCGATLGVVERGALVIGAARFLQLVTVHCLCCNHPVTWRPGPTKTGGEKAA